MPPSIRKIYNLQNTIHVSECILELHTYKCFFFVVFFPPLSYLNKQKRVNPEKNHLAHPQAELVSHELEHAPDMVRSSND